MSLRKVSRAVTLSPAQYEATAYSSIAPHWYTLALRNMESGGMGICIAWRAMVTASA